MMPNAAETIEKLARALERERLLSKLSECVTLEDYERVKSELRAQCESDK